MKKIILMIIFSLCLVGCSNEKTYEKYQTQFYDCFDTVIDVAVYAQSEKEGQRQLELIKDEFIRLHKLFDRYNNYEDVVNFKDVNDKAGIEPVKVSDEAFDLMKFSIDSYNNISRKVNIAMGPVVDMWTEYRELYEGGTTKEEVTERLGSPLPTKERLESLRPLLNMDNIVLDEKEKSIYLTEKGMEVEMGAVAKGYATELVAQYAEKNGVKSAIISAGGNVRIIGKPLVEGRDTFLVGVRNPNAEEGAQNSVQAVLAVNDTSIVTSGDYQRYFDLDGRRYSHIIDPDTLYPDTYFKSVTITNKDSGLCDFLSTAAFLSTEEEAVNMLQKENADGYFIDLKGNVSYTKGFENILKD